MWKFSSAIMKSSEEANLSIEMSVTLAQLPASKSEYCIHRVNNKLRMVNKAAYDPEIIAIGPYHRNKKNLKKMNEQKWHYLNSLLTRKRQSVEVFVQAVTRLEDKARKSYPDLPQLDSSEFVMMLVLDGCFIVELLRKFDMPSLREQNDPIFNIEGTLARLQRDLMLFENQIPFFILYELFDVTKVSDLQDKCIIDLAIEFFNDLLPGSGYYEEVEENWHLKTKHLLDLIHSNWLPLYAGKKQPKSTMHQENWKRIQSASELREAGVKFESIESFLLDINFTNGTLQMPRLVIKNRTECLFRNLIVYEENHPVVQDKYTLSYVKFLGCLINSAKDVELLRRHGIIDHWLGCDEEVSKIFSKINDSVTDPGYFYYVDVFNKINAHCSRHGNRWMAILRRRYLNSPWNFKQFFGFSSLVLALLQAIFSIIFRR